MVGQNQVFCSFCKSKHNGSRHIEVDKLASNIFIQLKRFHVNSNNETSKINTNVTYPECFKILNHIYKLSCVVVC